MFLKSMVVVTGSDNVFDDLVERGTHADCADTSNGSSIVSACFGANSGASDNGTGRRFNAELCSLKKPFAARWQFARSHRLAWGRSEERRVGKEWRARGWT